MDYDEARQYIEEAGRYGMVLGLSNMRELLSRLGNPQEELSFVPIAGTNGKGSVGAYMNEILIAGGIRTGRYLSPALFSYEERIQYGDKNGTFCISKWNVAKWLTGIRYAIDEMLRQGLPHPTPFEIETVMAFLEFREQGCQLVLLETGLGGRLDATNVIKTGVCQVFTAISRDHMQFLGESLTEIATEKAGIIKEGIPVVSCPQEEEAEQVLEQTAAQKGCRFLKADFSELFIKKMDLEGTQFRYRGRELETTLLGENQPQNAAVAIEAAWELQRQGFPISEEAIREGIRKTRWPGRFTLIARQPLVVIDGAHNEAAARSLARSLRIYFPGKRLIGVIGMFRDKEYDKVLKETLPFIERGYTLKPPGKRGLAAELLAECGRGYGKELIACKDTEEAYQKALEAARQGEEEAAVIVYGSLSFLHEIVEIQSRKEEKDGHQYI